MAGGNATLNRPSILSSLPGVRFFSVIIMVLFAWQFNERPTNGGVNFFKNFLRIVKLKYKRHLRRYNGVDERAHK